jgi:hypothetical protein
MLVALSFAVLEAGGSLEAVGLVVTAQLARRGSRGGGDQ